VGSTVPLTWRIDRHGLGAARSDPTPPLQGFLASFASSGWQNPLLPPRASSCEARTAIAAVVSVVGVSAPGLRGAVWRLGTSCGSSKLLS